MPTPILEARRVTKVFRSGFITKHELIALDDFSLVFSPDRPTITTIAGESGSGKTTLANLILGFVSPSSGQVLFEGKDIWKLSKAEWVTFRKEVQAVFQDPYEVYNPFYLVDSVLETVVKRFHLADTPAQGREIIINALEVLGLRPDEVLGKYPHQLSGGQRQRIMVARAFLTSPRFILADEPVSMVDASLRALILENMLRLKNEFGISFMYITHDLSTAYQISDDIYILYLGMIAEHGDVNEVIPNPKHPYTQLLLSSVPNPDPDLAWEGTIELPPEDTVRLQTRRICRFSMRCPYVMDVCRQSAPPLYEVGPNHYASCFLYRDHPIKGSAETNGASGEVTRADGNGIRAATTERTETDWPDPNRPSQEAASSER